MMIIYPEIDPVAFSIGSHQVRWYGLMYLLSFICAWGLAFWRSRRPGSGWTTDQVNALIFTAAVGLIIGGRIGYSIFYDFSDFIHAPWIAFKIWSGGRSFHGGLIGGILAIVFFSYKHDKSVLTVLDFAAPLIPPGLALGRLGNFINGELWGRVTDVSWGMLFPHVDNQVRHPSQIYEGFLEGVALFLVLWIYSSKPRPTGRVSAWFLIGYGLARFFAEFFRKPDGYVHIIGFKWLTIGQFLSLPMIFAGIIMLYWSKPKFIQESA